MDFDELYYVWYPNPPTADEHEVKTLKIVEIAGPLFLLLIASFFFPDVLRYFSKPTMDTLDSFLIFALGIGGAMYTRHKLSQRIDLLTKPIPLIDHDFKADVELENGTPIMVQMSYLIDADREPVENQLRAALLVIIRQFCPTIPQKLFYSERKKLVAAEIKRAIPPTLADLKIKVLRLSVIYVIESDPMHFTERPDDRF